MNKLILISLLLLLSCGERRKPVEIYEAYVITSLRVDDDAEYHITARYPLTGKIISIADVKDIDIIYRDEKEPTLIITYSDECCGEGDFVEWGKLRVRLPNGFLIETFDD